MRIPVIVLAFVLAAFSGNIAQGQSPDYQSTLHVFPQFVDGTAGTLSYMTTLQISTGDFVSPTQCTLRLWSLAPVTLTNARGARQTATVFNFSLFAGGWQILQSAANRALQSGSAILECDQPVSAHLIYTSNADGAVSAEASLSAAPPGRSVQILADERRHARLGIAIVNPFSVTAAYRIALYDVDGRLVRSIVVQIGSTQSFTKFLDEFVNIPADFRGPVIIDTLSGIEVYATGLRFVDDVFTAIPATVRVP
jgi:hypothetical protein